MTIDIKRSGSAATLAVSGRLDTTTAPALNKAIQEDLGNIRELILDLGGLDYISSAGLRVLLTAQKKMQAQGSMYLTRVCESVMEVLEMTGFADILSIR